MKKSIKNLKIILLFIFISFSFLAHFASADTKYLFWYETSNHDYGPLPNTGFNTFAECETKRLATKNLGHIVGDKCYTADPVKVTTFTLDQGATGKVGDYLTISGTNFFNVTKILFGTTEAEKYPQTNDTTKIRTQVPKGAKTSKITVVTQFRGQASSVDTFTVSDTPQNNNLWYYLNTQKQWTGGDNTEAECRARHHQYNIDAGVINGSDDCAQRTPAQVTASQSLDTPTNIDATEPISGDEKTYNLLAPIGGFKSIETNNIGKYFNILFQIAIGLCGVLAVIMIVIGGVQYMGDESVFGKTEAKGKILSAIFGLLIALGAYALLRTIDPALTGESGLTVDKVEAVIDVRDRADDPDFIKNIDSFDTSNISVNPSDYSDPTFLGYLAHQQGVAGASAILWSAKNGYAQVPSTNPFAKGNITKNMSTNFNPSSAQKTIGTSVLNTTNFLKYWAVKVAAVKRKTTPAIPGFIDTQITKVSSETGVDVNQLRTICRIESAGGCTTQASVTTVNKYGYSGLFQLSKDVFNKFGKSGGTILDAYHNSFAAAEFYKFNLTGVNKNWPKINK